MNERYSVISTLTWDSCPLPSKGYHLPPKKALKLQNQQYEIWLSLRQRSNLAHRITLVSISVRIICNANLIKWNGTAHLCAWHEHDELDSSQDEMLTDYHNELW